MAPGVCPFSGETCTKCECSWWIDESAYCVLLFVLANTSGGIIAP